MSDKTAFVGCLLCWAALLAPVASARPAQPTTTADWLRAAAAVGVHANADALAWRDEQPPAFYRRALRSHARPGMTERRVLAHLRLGVALWRKSCPRAAADGLCHQLPRAPARRAVRLRRRRLPPPRRICGSPARAKLVHLSRHRGLARRARAHLAAALRLARRVQPTTPTIRAAVAEALFFRAEQAFERCGRIRPPRRFPARARGRKRRLFERFIRRRSQLLSRARSRYQAVIQRGSAPWAIAATARIGQLFQRLADAVQVVPIPRPPIPRAIRGRPALVKEYLALFRAAYCDKIAELSTPLEQRAIRAFTACVDLAHRRRLDSRWSRLCARELHQLAPARFPLPSEIRPRVGFLTLTPVRVGLLRRPSSQTPRAR